MISYVALCAFTWGKTISGWGSVNTHLLNISGRGSVPSERAGLQHCLFESGWGSAITHLFDSTGVVSVTAADYSML